MPAFTGLVLAGSRGEGDALAREQGVRHRALLEVAGVPMLLRVLRTLRACPPLGPLVVSIDEPDALDELPELAPWLRDGSLSIHRSLSSPSRSVLDVLEGLAPEQRLLVTTADHALLQPKYVEHFLAAEAQGRADLCVGLVARSVLQARFPGSTRTYLPLRGEQYSGANLFAFHTPAARRAVAFWTRAEAFRKRPWRLVSVFGARTLLLFALRRLDLEGAFARVSSVVGARVEAIALPWPEAAIDVDRASDLELATELLSAP